LSILFYGKTTKKTSDGKLSIYMRVTIDGHRFEAATNSSIEQAKWQAGAGKAKGNTEEARTINVHLEVFRRKAYDYRQELLMEGEPFTIDTFKSKWLGLGDCPFTLMEVIRNHNKDIEQLIGKEYVKST